MSGQRPVDLGPMYLPLGEGPERRPSPPKPARGVRAGDVERFRAAMEGESQRRLHSPGLPGPLSLVPRPPDGEQAEEGEREERDDAAALDAPRPGFVDAIERLWVGEGLHSEREVRIGIHNRVLPETAVRMRMVQGAIHIDLTCADMRTAKWLAGQLEFLVSELGTRLGGAVVAAVEHVDRGVLRTVAWYPGCR